MRDRPRIWPPYHPAKALFCSLCALVFIQALLGQTDQVPALISQANSRYVDVQQKAIAELAKAKDLRAVEPLIELLSRNKHYEVREDVAQALGEIRDPRAVEPLIQALRGDKSFDVRAKAATALAEIKDPRAFEPLLEVVTTLVPDPSQNRSTVSRGFPFDAWRSAVAALGEFKDPRAVEPMIALMLTEKARIGPEMTFNSDLAHALGEIQDPRAVEPLITCLRVQDDRELPPSAASALGESRTRAPSRHSFSLSRTRTNLFARTRLPPWPRSEILAPPLLW